MRDHKLVRRFLLGELRETKAERVEKRLLEEDKLYDLCEAVEAELLEEAARGELAPAERDRVLKRLASSPQGRARLALAKDLAAIADRLPSTESMRRRPTLLAQPTFRWAMAAGLALVIGGVGGGIWNLIQEDEPGDQGQIAAPVDTGKPPRPGQGVIVPKPATPPVADRNEGQPGPEEATPPILPDQDQIAHETQPEPPPRVEVKPLVVELALLVQRSGEKAKEIPIPSGSEHIQFHVDVTERMYASYDAVLRSDGREIVRQSDFEPIAKDGGRLLVLDLPASALPAGRYEMEVYGKSAEGTPKLLMMRELEVTNGG